MGRKAVQVSARVPSVSQKEWTLLLFLTYLFLSPLLLEAQEGMCFALENTRTMAVSSSHLTITFTFLGIPLGPLQTGQQLSSNPLLLRIPDFQEDVSPGWYFPSFPLPPSFSPSPSSLPASPSFFPLWVFVLLDSSERLSVPMDSGQTTCWTEPWLTPVAALLENRPLYLQIRNKTAETGGGESTSLKRARPVGSQLALSSSTLGNSKLTLAATTSKWPGLDYLMSPPVFIPARESQTCPLTPVISYATSRPLTHLQLPRPTASN